MTTIRAAGAGTVEAPAERVYSILADYHTGHPAILPRQYFPSLVVEQGGVGEGTQIRFEVRMFGRTQEARARIEEPLPGRILLERVLDDRSTITRFIVDPLGPSRSRVTILTEWTSQGVQGWIERLLAPAVLRRIYRAELRNLAAYAEQGAATSLPGASQPIPVG